MRYDIGCGTCRNKGYTRVDIDPSVEPDIVGDIAAGIPEIPSGSADHISCNHVLEHIAHPGQLSALREMARILKDKGVIDIKVPHPGADSAMVPGHLHVIPVHYWEAIQAAPRAWMGDHWFVIDSVTCVVDGDAMQEVSNVGLCERFAEAFALKYLRNVCQEIHVRGHKCESL